MNGAVTAPARAKTFRAFSHPSFRLWISGLFISGIGTWMQMTAQDWTVLTALTDHDAGALSFVIALQTAPQLLLLPLAGYVSDRFPKRRVLLAAQVSLGLNAAILGTLVITGVAQYWHVCVLAALLGVAQAFDAPARQTMVNELVPPADLSNGIALGGATFNLARLVGPAIAGVLIGVIGAGWIFYLNALSFVAMILVLIVMKLDHRMPIASAESRTAALLGGFSYVVRHREIRIFIAVLFVVVGLVGNSMNLLIITAATTVFDAGAEGFGVLTSAVALGSVLGALFAAGRSKPRVRVLLISVLVVGGALLLASVMPTYLTFLILMPIVGIGTMSGMTTLNALVQTRTELSMRGRVMAIYMAAWVTGATIGAIIFGAIIEAVGSQAAIAIGGGAVLLTAAIAALLLRRESNLAAAAAQADVTTNPIPTGDVRGDNT